MLLVNIMNAKICVIYLFTFNLALSYTLKLLH